DQGVDRLVLGCTHYSFLTPMLREAIDAYPAVKQISARAQSNPVMLIDVADAVARQTQRLAGSLAHGHSRLVLRASVHPEKLHAALPKLHLSHLVARANDSSMPRHSSP
ncbi:MAG TPA: hypothetical protein VIO87_09485, partial [Methylotenera sp.]